MSGERKDIASRWCMQEQRKEEKQNLSKAEEWKVRNARGGRIRKEEEERRGVDGDGRNERKGEVQDMGQTGDGKWGKQKN